MIIFVEVILFRKGGSVKQTEEIGRRRRESFVVAILNAVLFLSF